MTQIFIKMVGIHNELLFIINVLSLFFLPNSMKLMPYCIIVRICCTLYYCLTF